MKKNIMYSLRSRVHTQWAQVEFDHAAAAAAAAIAKMHWAASAQRQTFATSALLTY